MRKLICWIFGHHWLVNRKTQKFVCVRCGKIADGFPHGWYQMKGKVYPEYSSPALS